MKTITKVYLIFTLIAIPLCLKAQSKFSVGISASPSFSVPVDNYSGLIKGKQVFKGGINCLYFIKKRIFLQSGLRYKLKSFMINDIPNTLNLIDSTGNINEDNITYYDIKNDYHFFSLPLIFNYQFVKKGKHSFYFSAGIEFDYLHKATVTHKDFLFGENVSINGINIDTENQYVDITYTVEDIDNKISGAVNLGFGLYKAFSPNFIMLVKPEYTYDLFVIKNNKEGSTNASKSASKFHALGISFEIYYSFQRKNTE